jgi:hypothetical protein
MESIVTVAIALLVGVVLLKFVFQSAKLVIRLAVLLLLVGGTLYLFAPDTLNKVVSSEQQEKVMNLVDSVGRQVQDSLFSEVRKRIQ